MIASLSIIAIALMNLSVGALVLHRRPRSTKHQAFFVFSLGCALWAGGFGLLLLTQDGSFIPILNAGGLILMLGAFMLAQAFIGIQFERTSVLWYLPFVIGFAIATCPGLLISDVSFIDGNAVPTHGSIFTFYTLAFVVYGTVIGSLLRKAYRASPAREREQLRYFFTGISVFLAVAILCNVVLPALRVFQLNTIGPAASLLPVLTTGYAVARHQLLDIRIVIKRGTFIGSLAVIGISVYAVLIATMEALMSSWIPLPSAISGLLAITSGILGARYIEHLARQSLSQSTMTPAPFREPRVELDELAHALQSPLAALKCGIELLVRSPDHERPSRCAELEQRIEAMSHLTRSAIDGVRAVNQEPERVDLTALTRTILEQARIIAEANDIILIARISRKPIIVTGSLRALRDAIENLVSNALRYTATSPTRRITVSLAARGSEIEITVRDTGTGISAEDLPHIFKRFYRSANTCSLPGHGLGLPLARQAIEAHGGTICVTSKLGIGSTFKIILPNKG